MADYFSYIIGLVAGLLVFIGARVFGRSRPKSPEDFEGEETDKQLSQGLQDAQDTDADFERLKRELERLDHNIGALERRRAKLRRLESAGKERDNDGKE